MRSINSQTAATMAKRRDFVNYASMYVKRGQNSVTLSLAPQDFRLNGNEFTDDFVDGDDFQVGTAIGKSVTLRLDNTTERFSPYDFNGGYFVLQVRLPNAWEDGNGNLHDATFYIGKFTIIDPVTTGTVIEVTGVDEMYKFDTSFDACTLDFSTNPSLYTILVRCCTDCGVAVGFFTFNNSSLTMSVKPEGITYREMVSYICTVACVNAKINSTGALTLTWYDMSVFDLGTRLDGGSFNSQSGQSQYPDGDTADGGSFDPWNTGDVYDAGTFDSGLLYHNIFSTKGLQLGTDDIKITGVRVTYEDADVLVGTSAYVLHVKDNPCTAGRESTIANFLYNRLNDFTFRPFSCSYLQDPTIEAGDCALVWDTKGNSYRTIITNVSFITNGYMSLAAKAKNPISQPREYKNPAAQAVVEARRNTTQQIDAYRQMIDHFTEIANDALGYYKTEVTEQGATVTYLHDQSTLAASTYIVKINSTGIFISEDGGQSYASGYDVTTATAVLNLVFAHGIIADWVESGIFKDKLDKFVLNLDTGALKLSLDSQVGTGQGSTTLGGMLTQIDATAQGLSSEVLRAQTAENALNSVYSGRYVPTISNAPANTWVTSQELKDKHINDLFVNTDTGDVYMWQKGVGCLVLTLDVQSETESPIYDYIRIYYLDNGQYKYTNAIGGTISGKKIIVPANSFWLYWHTDSSVQKWGFKVISVETTVCSQSEISTMYPNTTGSLPTAVTTTLTGLSTMPETAHPYPANDTIEWLWNTQVSLPSGDYGWALETSITAAYSQIHQTADQIALKVSKGQISSELSVESGQITLTSGRLVITTGNFQLDSSGTMTCTNANIKGTINLGYTNNTYGVLNIFGSNDAVNPLLKLDSNGLIVYSKDSSSTYNYLTKYAGSGNLNPYQSGSSRYFANFIGYYYGSDANPFAYIGIEGRVQAYQPLAIVNNESNIYMNGALAVNLYASGINNTFEYHTAINVLANGSYGSYNGSVIEFNIEDYRNGSPFATQYMTMDRYGFHGPVHGDTYATKLFAVDSNDNEYEGMTGGRYRVRVYSGGDATAGYYLMTIRNGIITEFTPE